MLSPKKAGSIEQMLASGFSCRVELNENDTGSAKLTRFFLVCKKCEAKWNGCFPPHLYNSCPKCGYAHEDWCTQRAARRTSPWWRFWNVEWEVRDYE